MRSPVDGVDDARRRDGELAVAVGQGKAASARSSAGVSRDRGRSAGTGACFCAWISLSALVIDSQLAASRPSKSTSRGDQRRRIASVAGPKTLPTIDWKASGERSATALWRFIRLSGVQTREAILNARRRVDPWEFKIY